MERWFDFIFLMYQKMILLSIDILSFLPSHLLCNFFARFKERLMHEVSIACCSLGMLNREEPQLQEVTILDSQLQRQMYDVDHGALHPQGALFYEYAPKPYEYLQDELLLCHHKSHEDSLVFLE